MSGIFKQLIYKMDRVGRLPAIEQVHYSVEIASKMRTNISICKITTLSTYLVPFSSERLRKGVN